MPIRSKGRTLGNLYLTEKEGAPEFSEEDERLLIAMSAHAAVAIENARLYEQVEHVAALEERERIGMDLHDGVIQSLYAVGLNLEECADVAGEDPTAVQERLNRAIEELNHTIGDIRSYIFDLRPPAEQTDFVEELAHLVKRFKVNTLLDAQLEVHGDVGRLPRGAADNLYHIVQEALNNVAKHSRASRALARVSLENSSLEISVSDNGVGFAPGSPLGGNHQGLRNMRERAGAIGATLTVHSARGRGTTVTVQLPLNGQEV